MNMEEHTKKTAFTVTASLILMVGIGFLVSNFQTGVTGAVPTTGPACTSNADCDDGISCTIDSCKNPGSEENSFCTSQPITYCRGGDGCCPTGCTPETDSDCR